MLLCDKTIKKLIETEDLITCPEGVELTPIQPASYDLRLGSSYITSRYGELPAFSAFIPKEGLDIPPKTFILMTTLEKVKIPNNICAFLEGRSSVGRTGIFIHNAGLIDPGFEGQITLEIFNASDEFINLKAGMRICQIIFHQMDDYCENPYNGKYQNQKGATASRLYLDEEMNK